jgi:hypothetical protein
MYIAKQLAETPVLAEEPAPMPVRVLLALPDYVTSASGAPLFNMPAAVSSLLGASGWTLAKKVMKPSVWAPAWTFEQLRAFVTASPQISKWAFPNAAIAELPVRDFPADKYEVVHFIGFVTVANGNPAIHLHLKNVFGMQVGAWRDALVRAHTRLLILQVPSEQYASAELLASYVAGAGGPAVLVVQSGSVPEYPVVRRLSPRTKKWSWKVEDKEVLDDYFLNVYANILHNRPLMEVARPTAEVEKRGLTATLLYGQGADSSLQFDGLLRKFHSKVQALQNAATQQVTGIQDLRRQMHLLHKSQRVHFEKAFASADSTLKDLTSSFNVRATGVVNQLNWLHEGTGVVPFVKALESVPDLDIAAQKLEKSRAEMYDELHKEVQTELGRAPRVLNVAFAHANTSSALGEKEGLVEEQSYDFLVDVGPRWKETVSLVKGNANFPEESLPPDGEGHTIQIVLICDDLLPTLSHTEIWLPSNTGPSFPGNNITRANSAGPARLRLLVRKSPEDNKDSVRTAHGRLSLYFENNLLQSALVKVGIIRANGEVLKEENSVEVDYVLTGGFRELNRFAARRLQQRLISRPSERQPSTQSSDQKVPKVMSELVPRGEAAEYPIGLNLTLNGNGDGQHRIIIKGHEEIAPVWRDYNPAASIQLLQNAREELSNCFLLKDSGFNSQKDTEGLDENNGKNFEQFARDLFRMALLGESLYNKIFSKVIVPGKDWTEWEQEFRNALASYTVIQVARTGPAEFVLPWALLYDYPLPDKDHLGWCKTLQDEWNSAGIRTEEPKPLCKYRNDPDHQKNIICPYGFWGLRHVIEQPISPLFKSAGDDEFHLPADVTDEIPFTDGVKLAVAVTRDAQLDQNAIAGHLKNLQQWLAFAPPNEADDWDKVCTMLQSPGIAYFFCHGEYDPAKVEPYLGVGLRDSSMAHRVYPNELLAWARTPPPKRWRDHRPLIFINGCHTSDLRPDDILNFVETFGVLGASGVIGTEIKVRLPLAAEIGESLLRKIAGGAKVCDAMYRVRWDLANKGNLLGLAYTPYCLSDLHVANAQH